MFIYERDSAVDVLLVWDSASWSVLTRFQMLVHTLCRSSKTQAIHRVALTGSNANHPYKLAARARHLAKWLILLQAESLKGGSSDRSVKMASSWQQ